MKSIAWVTLIDDSVGTYRNKVLTCHRALLQAGARSAIFDLDGPFDRLFEFDAVVFNKPVLRDHSALIADLRERGIIIGETLTDDAPVMGRPNFVLADSLAHVRYYHNLVRTYYWPLSFPVRHAAKELAAGRRLRFVYSGWGKNVRSILGAPLEGLNDAAAEMDLELRIICNEERAFPIPSFPKNLRFPIVRIDWRVAEWEKEIRACDVGFCPHVDGAEHWRKKTLTKFLHSASLGLPSIVSANEEASSVVTNGVTGMLAADRKAWRTAALKMGDSRFRSEMATNAQTLLKLRFSPQLVVQQLQFIIDYESKLAASGRPEECAKHARNSDYPNDLQCLVNGAESVKPEDLSREKPLRAIESADLRKTRDLCGL